MCWNSTYEIKSSLRQQWNANPNTLRSNVHASSKMKHRRQRQKKGWSDGKLKCMLDSFGHCMNLTILDWLYRTFVWDSLTVAGNPAHYSQFAIPSPGHLIPIPFCRTAANYIVSQFAVWEINFPGGVSNDNIKWRTPWAISEGLLIIAVAINYLPSRLYSAVFRFSIFIIMLHFFLCLIWLPIGVSKTYDFWSAKDVFTLSCMWSPRILSLVTNGFSQRHWRPCWLELDVILVGYVWTSTESSFTLDKSLYRRHDDGLRCLCSHRWGN